MLPLAGSTGPGVDLLMSNSMAEMVIVSGPTPKLMHLPVTEEDIKAALFNLA